MTLGKTLLQRKQSPIYDSKNGKVKHNEIMTHKTYKTHKTKHSNVYL